MAARASETYGNFLVGHLRMICKQRKLSADGNREELLQRLADNESGPEGTKSFSGPRLIEFQELPDSPPQNYPSALSLEPSLERQGELIAEAQAAQVRIHGAKMFSIKSTHGAAQHASNPKSQMPVPKLPNILTSQCPAEVSTKSSGRAPRAPGLRKPSCEAPVRDQSQNEGQGGMTHEVVKSSRMGNPSDATQTLVKFPNSIPMVPRCLLVPKGKPPPPMAKSKSAQPSNFMEPAPQSSIVLPQGEELITCSPGSSSDDENVDYALACLPPAKDALEKAAADNGQDQNDPACLAPAKDALEKVAADNGQDQTVSACLPPAKYALEKATADNGQDQNVPACLPPVKEALEKAAADNGQDQNVSACLPSAKDVLEKAVADNGQDQNLPACSPPVKEALKKGAADKGQDQNVSACLPSAKDALEKAAADNAQDQNVPACLPPAKNALEKAVAETGQDGEAARQVTQAVVESKDQEAVKPPSQKNGTEPTSISSSVAEVDCAANVHDTSSDVPCRTCESPSDKVALAGATVSCFEMPSSGTHCSEGVDEIRNSDGESLQEPRALIPSVPDAVLTSSPLSDCLKEHGLRALEAELDFSIEQHRQNAIAKRLAEIRETKTRNLSQQAQLRNALEIAREKMQKSRHVVIDRAVKRFQARETWEALVLEPNWEEQLQQAQERLRKKEERRQACAKYRESHENKLKRTLQESEASQASIGKTTVTLLSREDVSTTKRPRKRH